MIAEDLATTQAPRETARVDADHPWPGLFAFQEADHDFFFGREAATEELWRMVHRGRLTVLFSLSGLGKSSLICAGLFPRLRDEEDEEFLPVYLRLSYAPGSPGITAQIRESIREQAAASGVEAPDLPEGETLWELFHHQDRDFWSPRNRRVTPLLAFDQFEEIFKLGRSHPEIPAFLMEIADLIEGRVPTEVKARLDARPEEAQRFTFRRHDYKILLALREDSLPDLEELRPLIPSLAHNRMRLTRMTGEEAHEVVTRGGGDLVEPGAAEQIVRFVADEGEGTGEAILEQLRVQPPFLSLVCQELNNRRIELRQPRITGDLLAGHEKKILEDFYERNVKDLDPRVHTFIEEHLITASGFRDTVAWENALREGVTEEDLNLLIERRLVRKEVVGERPRIELTHDRLIAVILASREARRQREKEDAAETARQLAEKRERQVRQHLRRVRWVAVLFAFLGVFSFWQWTRVRQALATADLRQAVLLLDQGKSSEALPFLASAVRHNPWSGAAREALLGLLLNRSWALPTALLKHGDVVDAGDLSPDGRFAVTASRDRKARIWEIATGYTITLEHRGEVTTARFSPDGRLVATGCQDGAARVWEARGGKQVGPPLLHGGPVTVVEWSPDGRRLMTASADGTARIWKIGGGWPLGQRLPHGNSVIGAAWSPDGLRVATASRDNTARIWDAATGLPLSPPLVHKREVYSARFSPDGRWLVTASNDGTARIWDAQTGMPLRRLSHTKRVWWAEFSPDGRWVVTASADYTAQLWDAATGVPVGQPMRHGGRVRIAHFSRDGSLVLTASNDNTARLWNVSSGLPLCEPLRHGGWVYDARLDRDGRHVLTTSEDETARVWDITPRQAKPLELWHRGPVLYAELDPTGTRAVTASEDGTARLWNARTGEPVGRVMRHGKAVRMARFAPDGRRLVTASDDGTAQIWDVARGTPIGKPLHHKGPVTWADFSPDGRFVVTASQDKTGHLWNAATGAPVGEELRHGSGVETAAFSPDSRLVATGAKDKSALIWSVPSGQAVRGPVSVSHDRAVVSLAWSPSGDRLITASDDFEVRIWSLREGIATWPPLHLRFDATPHRVEVGPQGQWVMTYAGSQAGRWDLATRKPLGEPLQHGSEVAYASLSVDGKRVVTAGDHEDTPGDHLARVWDLRSGLQLGVPLPHVGALTAARFSHDGQRLITACKDGKARIWDVPAGQAWGARQLADLAEALAGSEIQHDLPTPILDAHQRIARLRKEAAGEHRDPASNESLIRWLLTPPEQRSATPPRLQVRLEPGSRISGSPAGPPDTKERAT